jgi:hypothetical protein
LKRNALHDHVDSLDERLHRFRPVARYNGDAQ